MRWRPFERDAPRRRGAPCTFATFDAGSIPACFPRCAIPTVVSTSRGHVQRGSVVRFKQQHTVSEGEFSRVVPAWAEA